MAILDASYMRLALGAGAVVGVIAPAVGFFLVQRRMALIGDGIGHLAFAGVAAGYVLGVSPVLTALVASVGGAVGIEHVRGLRRATGDQALAFFFYTGIAAGVVLISAAGALNANLFAFLFGSILTVTPGDLVLVTALGAVVIITVALLYRGFVAIAIDEEGARASGVPVTLLNVLLAAVAGATIAVSMRVVGILLIAALMVLPVMAAVRLSSSIRSTLLEAMAIGLASTLAGLTAAYYLDLAPGGAIVLLAGGVFLVAVAAERLRGLRDATPAVRGAGPPAPDGRPPQAADRV